MTLKTKNVPYLVAFLVIIYIFFAMMNKLDWSFTKTIEIGKEGVKFNNPVLSVSFYFLALILTYILPPDWKHRIIYLRWTHPLPGSRVFSELLDKDERISRNELIEKYGELPTSPNDQNRLWYKIYKQKQTDEVVLNSHGRWLLFRDMFAILIIVLVPSSVFTFWNAGIKNGAIYTIISLFVLIALWISARNAGERFVCNVLAR